MLDLKLLRIMKWRKDFFKLKGRVPKAAMDPQTRTLIDDFGAYFESIDHDRIDLATFLPVFRSRHPKLDDKQRTVFEKILTSVIKEDVPEKEYDAIMRNVLELRLGTELANMVARFDAGELPNIHTELTTLLEEHRKDAGVAGLDYITTDIGELLQADDNAAGVSFRLKCLQESLRPLRDGDFGIIAARPDKGKTTFVSSEVTFMAPQLETGRDVLWLNNEGPGERIIPRLYQSALGITQSEMLARFHAGQLATDYAETVGGPTRIKIVDIHGHDNFAVEAMIDRCEPGIVVFDMIDNIRGFGDAARTDLGLERMYQWARESAVKYGFAGLATSQISAEGDGLLYPTQSMLKDSKTGKQGACDFMIMIGASNDVNLQGQRGIGVQKNKLRLEGRPSDPKEIVKFDPQRARYVDVPTEDDLETAAE